MKRYVVRRARGSHVVFTFPPGGSWAPTPAGGVACRPSWHAPRAMLAEVATYGARVGVPLPVGGRDGGGMFAYERMGVLREEVVGRVRSELRNAMSDAVKRFWPGEGAEEPACVVCVVGEPLTVVGFNEDARLGALPRDWTDTAVTAEHGGMLRTYHVAYIGDDCDYVPETTLLVHRGSEEADVRRTLDEGGMRLVSLTHAPGRGGWDAVCEVGFHAYSEVPLELAGVDPVPSFPFEGDASVWDGLAEAYGVAPAFGWGPGGLRECYAGSLRALLVAQFLADLPADRLWVNGVPRGGERLSLRVGLIRGDCTCGTHHSDPSEHLAGCPGAWPLRMSEAYHRLKGMGLPVDRACAVGGGVTEFYVTDDVDAEPFVPAVGFP